MLVAIVTLRWLWSRNHDAKDHPTATPLVNAPGNAEQGKVIRGTSETGRAWETLKAQTKGSYSYDVWQEASCNGVAVFYLPDAEDEDIAWYWFDVKTERFIEQVTLGEVIQALAPHLDHLERYTPKYMVGQLSTPEGRPLYSVGRVKPSGVLQIGFSPNRCGAVPDIVQIMKGGPSPVNVDLPAAIEQIRQQRGK